METQNPEQNLNALESLDDAKKSKEPENTTRFPSQFIDGNSNSSIQATATCSEQLKAEEKAYLKGQIALLTSQIGDLQRDVRLRTSSQTKNTANTTFEPTDGIINDGCGSRMTNANMYRYFPRVNAQGSKEARYPDSHFGMLSIQILALSKGLSNSQPSDHTVAMEIQSGCLSEYSLTEAEPIYLPWSVQQQIVAAMEEHVNESSFTFVHNKASDVLARHEIRPSEIEEVDWWALFQEFDYHAHLCEIMPNRTPFHKAFTQAISMRNNIFGLIPIRIILVMISDAISILDCFGDYGRTLSLVGIFTELTQILGRERRLDEEGLKFSLEVRNQARFSAFKIMLHQEPAEKPPHHVRLEHLKGLRAVVRDALKYIDQSWVAYVPDSERGDRDPWFVPYSPPADPEV
ncbi:hypothetical protein B7494_g5326 [Chlorociboria aeruginascens]|nr:hypothetical protein B7494_g5326 [Chlorociboria aeruginascens]